MSSWRDRINQFTGKTRFVVCRIFVHLTGNEVAPILGVFNQEGQNAIESEGDLEILGESLVNICQKLLDMKIYWESAANEGDFFWKEEEAGDYFTELSTDSAQRYLSEPEPDNLTSEENTPLSLPVTRNVVVMITIGFRGESSDLETNLADREALEYGLKALINLHYQEALEAINIDFSPARLGDELTNEQVLLNFAELIPL
ncbi:MAG TPA: hypothetical protein DCF68_08330 [Cyanothece sp. UBA12306]|nr:hypothetical protein [Cyanothece sp. UBA12306]